MVLKSSNPNNELVVISNVLTVSKYEGYGRWNEGRTDRERDVPIIGFSMIGRDTVYNWFYDKTEEGKKMRDEDYEKISNL